MMYTYMQKKNRKIGGDLLDNLSVTFDASETILDYHFA